MPNARITDKTEVLLTIKRRATGLSNKKLIEFAVINLRVFPVKNFEDVKKKQKR